MSVAADLQALLGDLRAHASRGDLTSDRSDEHVRWHTYLQAIEVGATYPQLREAVTLEPDRNVAASVVFQVLEKVSSQDGQAWVDALAGDTQRQLATDRLADLVVLRDVRDGATYADVTWWSDWLQRRAFTATSDVNTLDALAERGRTRRVRAGAAHRAREIRRTAG